MGEISVKVKKVLFACIHNSERSQMAKAFARYFSMEAVESDSAGTILGYAVNPLVVEAVKKKGIDISEKNPKLLTPNMVKCADRVIMMGCSLEETCPALQIPCENWNR